MIAAEYIWLDGAAEENAHHMPCVRSKTRMVSFSGDISSLPQWSYDGGSTYQAGVVDSDLILNPVRIYKDPFREEGILVLCEVLNQDGTPHPTNHRHKLCVDEDDTVWFGFEQEYTLFKKDTPAAFMYDIHHKEQGSFYCGAGAHKVYHRNLVEKHFQYCLQAGVDLYGYNAEVMPGQWEFQTAPNSALKSSDDLWIARYILERVFEPVFITVSYYPKPMSEWNGAGCHTNFSTLEMRETWKGIETAIERLRGSRHYSHMSVYGVDNDKRMTGTCETSFANQFTVGVTDRSCSIRIPIKVHKDRKGYLEDRRPAANVDPYRVCDRLIKSVVLDED